MKWSWTRAILPAWKKRSRVERDSENLSTKTKIWGFEILALVEWWPHLRGRFLLRECIWDPENRSGP